MQALFFLAFALALREASNEWRELPLRFVPAALLAAGSVYTYSFPGLIWLDRRQQLAWALAGWVTGSRFGGSRGWRGGGGP